MEKTTFYFKWILRISIILAAIYNLFTLRWVGIAAGLAILLLTFLIDYINLKKKIFADKIMILLYVFCLFSLVMGVMLNFYDKISWWDIIMHLVSGILFGVGGNMILNIIQSGKEIESLTRFLFVIGIACIGGLVWEMYEFTADMILGIDSQKVMLTGVSDTMEDLIINLAGGFLAALYFSIFNRSKK